MAKLSLSNFKPKPKLIGAFLFIAMCPIVNRGMKGDYVK